MPKALKDSVHIVQPGDMYHNPKITRCSECRKKFERLSADWVYHFVYNSRDCWQCSWSCYRKGKQRLFPKKALRGEYYAETGNELQKRYLERRKMTKLGNNAI